MFGDESEHVHNKSPDSGLIFVELVRPLGPILVWSFTKIRSDFGLILDMFSPDF